MVIIRTSDSHIYSWKLFFVLAKLWREKDTGSMKFWLSSKAEAAARTASSYLPSSVSREALQLVVSAFPAIAAVGFVERLSRNSTEQTTVVCLYMCISLSIKLTTAFFSSENLYIWHIWHSQPITTRRTVGFTEQDPKVRYSQNEVLKLGTQVSLLILVCFRWLQKKIQDQKTVPKIPCYFN